MPEEDTTQPAQIVAEFLYVVDAVFGVYLDAITGFRLLAEKIEMAQGQMLADFKKTDPEKANVEYLDSVSFTYGKGDPNTTDAVLLHERTQGQVKAQNKEGAQNYRFMGNMFVITVYQYWEDHYRARLAEALGMKKNALKAPIMGDLRLLRQAIIHHHGVATKDVKKCQLLKWYEAGDEVFINQPKLEEIIKQIHDFLNGLLRGGVIAD